MDKKTKTAAAAAIVALSGASAFMTYQAIAMDIMSKLFKRKKRNEETDPECLDWLSSSNADSLSVRSFDGLELSGTDIHNHDDDRYLIMVHGLNTSKSGLYPRAREFDSLGYNILLIDQRGAGDSQGKYYTYGVKESQDLMIWIGKLIELHPDAKICLYGLSMGAATTMMSCAFQLPQNVRCIVEESGYSSLEEEFRYMIKKDYKFAFTYPVLKMIESVMSNKLNMNLSDVSPKKCLEENEIPILFVHGEKDDLVPIEAAKILYNHNKGVKKYYPVKEAGHCQCDKDADYYGNVDSFIREYL